MDPYRAPDDLDFDNPYAAPKSSIKPEAAAPRDLVSIPCSIDGILSAAWSVFRANMWPCIWLFWGMLLLSTGFRMLVAMMQVGLQTGMPGNQASLAFVNFGLTFFALIVQTWLEIGMNLGLLKTVRGQPVSFDVLFSGGRYVVTAILSLIVCACLFVAMMIIPAIVGAGILVSFRRPSGAFLLAILGVAVVLVGLTLYLSARLFQFLFLVMDQDAGAIDAIQRSWQLTRGRAGTIILVNFAQLAVLVAGVLALCVGVIFAWPFAALVRAVLYLALLGPHKPSEHPHFEQDRMPMAEWEEDG
jgi:hypothetical protein